MSRIKIPAIEEIIQLAGVRSDICVSIYLQTSPMRQDASACRIALDNYIKETIKNLLHSGHDKRRIRAVQELLESTTGDPDFGLIHANSIAILATPENIKVYRLANKLGPHLEISDRFFIKPLLRAFTFRHIAYILALSENQARVVELLPDRDPEEITVANMPQNITDALGLRSSTAALPLHVNRSDARKVRLTMYANMVDDALRPLTENCRYPVILVAAEPLASIFRAVNTSCLIDEIVFLSPDPFSPKELETYARPALDAYYVKELEEVKALFEERNRQGRAAIDLRDAAKAATYGMVSLALVDFDYRMTGFIDEDGLVTFSEEPEAYGLIDEIVKRTLENGGKVLAVRKEDMVGDSGVAAVLRYPFHFEKRPD